MGYFRRAVELWRVGGPVELARGVCRFSRVRANRIKARLISLNYRIKYGQAAPVPTRLITVNPALVEYVQAPRLTSDLPRRGTYIRDGQWDVKVADTTLVLAGKYEDGFDKHNRQIVPFENYILYQSCVEHFNHGTPWEQTELCQWLLDAQDVYRYETDADVWDRLSYLDELYEEIKSHRYKSQSELDAGSNEYGEVVVNIGRDGRLILDDGRHRLTLAKVLEIDRIPVRVFVRHSEWQRLRHLISTGNVDSVIDCYRMNLDHPDLDDL